MKLITFLGVNMRKAIFTALLVGMFSGNAFSAPSWTSGNLTNITSTSSGLMIMTDGSLPDNCAGTPYGWLLIKEANKTIVATTLATWLSGNKAVSVYTSGMDASGYCVVTQVDPH